MATMDIYGWFATVVLIYFVGHIVVDYVRRMLKRREDWNK